MRVRLSTLLVLVAALSVFAADDNYITIEQGSSQSTYLNNQFAESLILVVKTNQNQPAQVQVTLTAPASGPSALFNSATGSFTHVAFTDSAGRISVNMFANSNVGTYTITARAPGASPVQITLYNNANPATVSVVSGSGQSAVVNTLFANKLRGRLTDASGKPVVFVNVVLEAQEVNGATGSFPGDLSSLSVETDTNGYFETSIQAGKKIGAYTVVSRVPDNPSATTGTWSLVNTYAAGRSISARSGENQVTTVNTNFRAPLVAFVGDEFGNPVPDITVTFQIPRDSAAFGSFLSVPDPKTATAVTNTDGIAMSPFIAANAVSGGYTATASAVLSGSTKTAPFALYNNPNYNTLTYTVISPKVQISTIANQLFAQDLVIQVTDQGLNPVPNVTISFQAPTDPLGATCFWGDSNSYIAVTNGTGHVVAPAPRASKIKGNFGVSYNPISPTRDPISLLVNPDVPAVIKPVTGSAPTVVNSEFEDPLLAIVLDQFGNGVPDTPVWFFQESDIDSCLAAEDPQTQLTDVPSILFDNLRCSKNIVGDSIGSVLSLSPLRINLVAGTYNIVALVASNYTVRTTFTLTNLPAEASSLAIFGNATKEAKVGMPFDNLEVRAFDMYNNLVPGVTVNFWAPDSPVTALVQPSAVTGTGTGASGPLGLARTSALASERPGIFEVKANSTGIANEVTFTLINLVNDPYRLLFRSNSASETVVDQFFEDSFVVLVTDQFDNPVKGALVQFEAPDTDQTASGYFTGDSVRLSGEDGLVTVQGGQDFKANTVTGEYQLKVTVPGYAVPAVYFTLTNTPELPHHFDILYPNPADQINAAVVTEFHFPTIRLYLLDKFGNAVPNQAVQFQLTPGTNLGAGIPSGLFETNSLTYVPQTNGSGYVSARQIRANEYAGTFVVHVNVPDFLDVPALNLDFSFYNKPAKPYVIESNYAAVQTTVAEQFDGLQLTVYDEYGNTVLDDVTVELSIGTSDVDPKATAYFTDGEDESSFIALSTDKGGNVVGIPSIFANHFIGKYTLTIGAKVDQTVYAPLYIELTNIPGPVTLIDVLTGANQHVKVTDDYEVLVIQLFDKFNNTVYSKSITFQVNVLDKAAADFDGAATYTAESNEQGVATSGVFTANQIAGEFRIYVEVDSTYISIPQFNIPNDPWYFQLDEAGPREAVVDHVFADPISLSVFDAYHNLVPNTPVTFTSPATGASLFFDFENGDYTNYVLSTNSAGHVSTGELLANKISGAYNVTVACVGYFAPEIISFTNKPDAAYRLALPSPDYKVMALINEQSETIHVLVLDQFDNPVPGITVTFTVVPNPSNNAKGSFQSTDTTSTGVSDSNGFASPVAVFTANSVVGPYKIVASAEGLADIDISLYNSNNVPDIISQSTPDQLVQAGTDITDPLYVVVLDQGSNPATGYTVTFRTPETGPSCLFANNKHSVAVTIDEQGKAVAPACTANGNLGKFNVTADTYNSLSVDMGVTILVGNASNIIVSGDKQSVQVTNAYNPVEVTVTDSFGNVVSGAKVTFTTPASGASASFDGQSSLVLPTGPDGKVSTSVHTLTANTVAGAWNLSVAVQGIVLPELVKFTNTPAAASKLTLVSGGNQSTTVATSFSKTIVFRANDQYDNVVSGSSVTLTVPATGASLAFSNSQNTITGTTGTDGTYTVNAPTASTVAGTFSVSVTGAESFSFSMTNTPGAVTQFTRQGSASRTAKVNTAYTETFKVLAADKYGNPRGGVSVTFFAPTTCAAGSFAGSVSSYTATTDATGVATSSVFTANTVAGKFNVLANTTSVSTSLTFACENQAGDAAHIEVNSGNSQSVKPAATMSPLAVIVSDQYFNPVTGASVTFTAPTTGSRLTFASTNTASGTTDSDGVVSTVAPVAGTVAGSFKVTATSGALSTQFSLTIVAGSPAALAVISGSGQSAVVNTQFGSAISVNVTDQYNNLVSGAPVTFVAPASGPSATFSSNTTVLSNAQGVATSSSFTATTTAGSFVVSASAPGTAAVNVQLFNTPASPSQVIISGKPTTSAIVGTKFSELAVVVKDQYDNTVSGVEVTFNAPASGPSGVFNQTQSRQATSVTGSNGVATSPVFVANTVSGSYSVNVTVAGSAATTSFALTNEPDVAFAVSISSGDAQSTSTGTQFAQPLNVLVKDKYNNPVAGVSVVFAIQGNSSSVFANGLTTSTVLTTITGRASSPLITAGTETGTFTVFANVTSVGSVTFSLSIVEPPVATPVQVPAAEEPSAPVGSAPTSGTTPVRDDAGTVSSSTTVAINSAVVLLATVFCICF